MSLLLRSSCLAVLALAATAAPAAELGDATVRSYIGQPLSADIDLTDLTAQELADLQVRVARPDVFQGANVKMNPALAGATLAIARRENRRVLQVTTSAPVQAEVLHLYFQLASGGRERIRGVTLWLSPDPKPVAVAPAPAALAVAPAPAPAHAGKPAARRAGADGAARLVARVSPGSEATSSERELLATMAHAFGAQVPKAQPGAQQKGKPVLSAQEVRRAALKHASTADDFRRGAKSQLAAVEEPPEAGPAQVQKQVQKQEQEQGQEPEQAKKAASRSILASKAELAEAARATRASVAAGMQPAAEGTASAAPAAPQAQPAAGQPGATLADGAMLTKLAELEGKLKTLQAQLAMANTAGAAHASVAVAGKAAPSAQVPAAATAAPAVAQAPRTNQPAAAAAAPVDSAAAAQTPARGAAETAIAQHSEAGGAQVVTSIEATSAAALATVEEAKPTAQQKKAAEPPPPEPRKEIKISRPKLLTFLFAGSLVLLLIFGIIVHAIRKKKMQRSPIVRQSWSRDEDDSPARTEPTAGPAPAPARAAPLQA